MHEICAGGSAPTAEVAASALAPTRHSGEHLRFLLPLALKTNVNNKIKKAVTIISIPKVQWRVF